MYSVRVLHSSIAVTYMEMLSAHLQLPTTDDAIFATLHSTSNLFQCRLETITKQIILIYLQNKLPNIFNLPANYKTNKQQ